MSSAVPVELGGRSSPARPLASAQRALWVSQRRNVDAPLQNMAQVCRLGIVDVDRLIASFEQVVHANDILRTRYVEVNSVPSVRIVADITPTEVIDLDPVLTSEWAAERATQAIDLSQAVYDSVVVRHPDSTVSWFLNLHHLVTDATSTALIVAAAAAAYDGIAPTASSFLDWSDDVAKAEPGPRVVAARSHWASRTAATPLPGFYQPVRLPVAASTRHPVSVELSFFDAARTRLGAEYRMLSDDLGWTALLLTVTAAHLHRITGAETFAIGVPIHNRSSAGSTELIGPVMEVYPVDVIVEADDTFATLHRRLSRSLLTTIRFAGTDVGQPGDGQAIVNVIPRAAHESFAGTPVTTEWVHPGASDPQHLMRVQLTPFGPSAADGGLELALDINHGGANADHRDRAVGHFNRLLHASVADPNTPILDVALLDDAERESLASWGSGAAATNVPHIVDRLRDALATNHRLTLEDPDRGAGDANKAVGWTGAELWNWSGQIASWLSSRGVSRGDRIGLELDRSAEAIATIIAALRLGASYVPIDPEQPQARRTRLAERAGCELVVSSIPADLSSHGELSLDEARGGEVAPRDSEAYLLFTSGSTGEPKGVPISHDGLARYVDFAVDRYVDPDTRPVVPLFSALTFDLTVTSIFVPLLTGGQLIVVRPGGTPGLRQVAERTDITWAKATPSHLEVLVQLMPADHSLNRLVVGGEAFTMRLARRLRRALPSIEMFNEYGPTEAVVGCMIHQVTPEELDSDQPDVPIGVPAPGVTLHIVDDAGAPVPAGVAGELLISAPGLTAGYLDAPVDGESPFIDFASSSLVDGGAAVRAYRSGDLVRLIDDNTAVYHGRLDEQVKVGGIRLEPAEVEEALGEHPAIERAAVRLWTPTLVDDLFHCVRCGLPSNVPSVRFDDDGVCDSCHTYDEVKGQAEAWFKTPTDLVARRDKGRKRRTGNYDAVALLSGGKDSTYMVYKLVEAGFDVFALTLDNGFISEGAKENVRQSVADLGIGHEFMTSDDMNEIFRESLDRFSNVCHGCYKTIYTLATNKAVELGAPLIVTGLSRGQLFETRLVPQQFDSGRFDPDAIDRAVIEARKAYHRVDDPFNRLLDNDVFADDSLFEQVEYIDYYRYIDVELAEMLEFLDTQAPWSRPADTGRSTNCLVNAAGIHTHLTEQGYHNYAMPYAWDVRLGHKNRREAMDELDDQLDLEDVGTMLREIDYEPRARSILSAWFELAPGAEQPSPEDLRTFVADRLASHQIPAAFMAVDELPRTSNGKLDVDALPAPDRIHRAGPAMYVSPSTAVETAIVAVWERVLGVEPIGVDDDFFALGGDSLAALEMAIAVSEALGRTVREDLAFSHPTPKALAAALGAESDDLGSPEPTPAGVAPELSAAESGLVFEYRNRNDKTAYNVGRRYTVDGVIDADRFRVAVEAVIARHASLRWTFSQPRVELEPSAALDFAASSGPQAVESVSASISELHDTPFDIDHGPLMRVRVDPLDDGSTSVAILTHHTSADDQSFALIWADIDAAYRGDSLLPSPVDVGGHGVWQREHLSQDSADYWADQWDRPATTSLGAAPFVTGEPESDGYVAITSSVTAADLIAGPGTTPFATSFAAFAALVDRYGSSASTSGLDPRVAIGVTSSVRDHALVESSVGYFINTIPVVVEWPADANAAELADRASQRLTESVPHRAYPYMSMITDAIGRQDSTESAGAVPGVSLLLAYEDLTSSQLGTMAASYEILSNDAAVVDGTVFVQRIGDRIDLGIEYRGSTVGRARAEQVLADLDAVLRQMLDEPHRAVANLTMASSVGSILDGDSLSSVPSVSDAILNNLETLGDAPAVRCGGDRLTWHELRDRSAGVAADLQSRGVKPGDRVAVSLPRSVDVAVALVAILRVGAVYVPVDPSYPSDRVARITSIAKPATMLDALAPAKAEDVGVIARAQRSEDDPLYVIFTSGSTGEPRGVEVTHGQLNASNGARRGFFDEQPERFLMLSSIGFDSSIVGLFWTLSAGGELVLPTEREAHDPDALLRIIDDADISHTLMVPTLYGALLERGTGMSGWPSTVMVAGEACAPEIIRRHFERRGDSALINEYGPTEATVWSTAHHCGPADGALAAAPIGRPIPGTRNIVLGRDLNVVPGGVEGQLAIVGPGVTNGYIDDAEATASRFVTLDDQAVRGERAYLTGDRVSTDQEGRLVFRGRIDDQLNVGGARVEPSEIERVLSAQPGVDEAIVVAVDARPVDEILESMPADDSRAVMEEAATTADPVQTLRRLAQARSTAAKRLVAHLSLSDVDGAFDEAAVRSALADQLPATSQPTAYGIHASLPKTPHGKADRAAAVGLVLRTPSPVSIPGSVSDAAGSELEVEIAALFSREIGRPVGIDDDFFANGGNSLAALTVAVALEERFDQPFPVTKLIDNPTARSTAALLAPSLEAVGAEAHGLPEGELLMVLRAGTDHEGPAVVLVAPGTGHLMTYQPLATAIAPDVDVFGLALPGADGKRPPLHDVGDIADEMLADWSLLGDRPIVLLGGSSGGILAWELALKLERRGTPVAGLILQDTIHPQAWRDNPPPTRAEQYKALLEDRGVAGTVLETIERGRRKLLHRRAAKSMASGGQADAPIDPEAISHHLVMATDEMTTNYFPGRLERSVRLFAAETTDLALTVDRWEPLCTELRVDHLEGDHHGDDGIGSPKRVGVAARLVEDEIRRSQS